MEFFKQEQESNEASKEPLTFNADGTRRGFIDPSCRVADTAHVGPNARVLKNAQILDQARVDDDAVVYGAILQDYSCVTGKGFAGPGTLLKDKAWVIEQGTTLNVTMTGESEVSGSAYVDGADAHVEMHDRVVIGGFARVQGHNILRGKMQVRGTYSLIDAGEITSDDLFVQ